MRKKIAWCQIYQQVTGVHWCLWDIQNLILLLLLSKTSLHEAQRNSTLFFNFLPIESRNNRPLLFIILVSKMKKIRKPGCLFSINCVNETFLPICFMMIVKQISLSLFTYVWLCIYKIIVYILCLCIYESYKCTHQHNHKYVLSGLTRDE